MFVLSLLFGLCIQSATADTELAPAITIIIDDIGNNLAEGEAAIALPGPVTYAVLPFSAFGKTLAEKAHAAGKRIMLHAPMANTHHYKLGPGALTPDQSEAQLKATLRKDLAAVPHVAGINNHMGSLLTQNETAMSWVMDVVKEQNLFFVDSRTTAKSVAYATAKAHQVPTLERDVFLDHKIERAFIQDQFLKAVLIARKYGEAVVIGHPYPETIHFLQEALPALDEAGVQLISAQAMLLRVETKATWAKEHRPSDGVDSVPEDADR